jgi:hypothetical protein
MNKFSNFNKYDFRNNHISSVPLRSSESPVPTKLTFTNNYDQFPPSLYLDRRNPQSTRMIPSQYYPQMPFINPTYFESVNQPFYNEPHYKYNVHPTASLHNDVLIDGFDKNYNNEKKDGVLKSDPEFNPYTNKHMQKTKNLKKSKFQQQNKKFIKENPKLKNMMIMNNNKILM